MSEIHIVLYQPEIPGNTGNVIRLCANMGADLHLIRPLGFVWDDRRLRRAGLDYHEFANITQHASLEAALACIDPDVFYNITTRGRLGHHEVSYEGRVALIFGPESRGLPEAWLAKGDQNVRIPMQENSRSLNLSNAVSVVAYEVWRWKGFTGAR